MGKYTSELQKLNQEFLKVYIPATALTNPDVAVINRKLEELATKMQGKEECDVCHGWGGYECNECGGDRECRQCDSTGLVDKE